MLADDAIVSFARFAAPLPLHTGRFFALFGMGGSIQDANGTFAVLMLDDFTDQDVIDKLMIPFEIGQKFL